MQSGASSSNEPGAIMNRLLTAVTLLLLIGSAEIAVAAKPGVSVEILLEADETILGQEFEYPDGKPNITVALITVPPHASLPLHEHPVPLTAVIMQGVLVVDYEGIGEIRYRAGDTFVEAFNTPHSGRNGGKGTVKILAIYAGAVGIPNSVNVEP